jgi:hypothetical protein
MTAAEGAPIMADQETIVSASEESCGSPAMGADESAGAGVLV